MCMWIICEMRVFWTMCEPVAKCRHACMNFLACVCAGGHSLMFSCVYSTWWVCNMCKPMCPWGNVVPILYAVAEGEAVGGREMLFDLWVCFPGGSPVRVVIADIKHLKTSSKRWRRWSSPDSSGDLLAALEKCDVLWLFLPISLFCSSRQTLKLRLQFKSWINEKKRILVLSKPVLSPDASNTADGQWPYACKYNTAGAILASVLEATAVWRVTYVGVSCKTCP